MPYVLVYNSKTKHSFLFPIKSSDSMYKRGFYKQNKDLIKDLNERKLDSQMKDIVYTSFQNFHIYDPTMRDEELLISYCREQNKTEIKEINSLKKLGYFRDRKKVDPYAKMYESSDDEEDIEIEIPNIRLI